MRNQALSSAESSVYANVWGEEEKEGKSAAADKGIQEGDKYS